MQRLNNLLSAAAGLAVFVALILLYNLQYAAFVGDPRIPSLQNKWWAGYFLNPSEDTVWCLVRFVEPVRTGSQMALITDHGEPVTFGVERNSSDETFVRFSMRSPETGLTIIAKQLYEGKRYFFGRLMAGRWRDFWRKNDDLAIRGTLANDNVTLRFEIEPISESRVMSFYSRYVAPGTDASLASLTDQATAAFRTPLR